MKINKCLLTLMFLYLTISSSLIETKNILQKSVLNRAKLYKKMERIKTKKSFKELIIKTLNDILYTPMSLYNWIYKSEPVDAEGKSSHKDKIQGFIFFIMEIIRAFDFNPISQIIGKLLDSHDQVESCVNNSEQILSIFNEAFFASKESDTDEKQIMQHQQMEIINLLLDDSAKSKNAESSSENSDEAKLQRCLRAESIVKNPQEHIKKMLTSLVQEKDARKGLNDLSVNSELSMHFTLSIQHYVKTLQKRKAEFHLRSAKRVEAIQFNNIDPNNFCVTTGAKYFCIKDYEEIRTKFLEETTVSCDLNYKRGMEFDQFFNLYICEEFDFMNKEWKIESLKGIFKLHGNVPVDQDIEIFPILNTFANPFFRRMYPVSPFNSLVSVAIENLFAIDISVKKPTRQDFEKFLTTKLSQFKDSLDCSAFKPKSWFDSVFKIFGMLRKATKAIANVLRVFNDCVKPSFDALRSRAKQVQELISQSTLLKFGQQVKQNEKIALFNAAKSESLGALESTLKTKLNSDLDSEAKVTQEIKEEQASSLAEFEPKKSEAENNDSDLQENNDLNMPIDDSNSYKGFEKSKISEAIENAAKLQYLEDADKLKIEASFASADNVIQNLFDDPFSDGDTQSGVYARELVKSLSESQVPEKIAIKLKVKTQNFISQQIIEFEKNPFAYSTKIAANAVMCASQRWLCAARGAVYLTKFAIVDEVDIQADKLINHAINSKIIKQAPELVHNIVEFAAKKGKEKLLEKLDNKLDEKIKAKVPGFNKKEINNEAFKDLKLIGDVVDYLKNEGKDLVLEEIKKKFPRVPVSGIVSVGQTGYEFYKFRKEQKEKQKLSQEKSNHSSYKKRKLFKRRLLSEKKRNPATAEENANNNFISETNIFIENNRLYLNFQIRLMVQEELKNEMPTIKEKFVSYLNKGVTGAVAVNNSFGQLSDLQNDLSTIFPSLENFFQNNLQSIMAYIVQLVGLGPINVLLYGKDIIDFMLLLKQAFSAQNVKDRWRIFGKIIGVVIKFFRGDKFRFFSEKFLSFFSYRRRLLKRRFKKF